jgi:mRNA interferase YafQ
LLRPIYRNNFERDIKLLKKRGKKLTKIVDIIELLVQKKQLPTKHRDHILIGNYKGRRECHVEPDWLLIYQIENETIIFERTGSHADLFK